jgi:division protein CdvB (Snf7/Vps24/ESCRT-III family)
MTKILSSTRLSLEQIQLGLDTITQLGDGAVGLGPAVSIVKGIQVGLYSMIPEADQSFNKISDLVGSVIDESEQAPVAKITGLSGLNEESAGIVEEANSMATVEPNMEHRLRTSSKSHIET